MYFFFSFSFIRIYQTSEEKPFHLDVNNEYERRLISYVVLRFLKLQSEDFVRAKKTFERSLVCIAKVRSKEFKQ